MKKLLVLFLFSIVFTSCKSTKPAFAKGADVGWLPQMEATGYKFYDADGKEKDCLQLLKDRGMNSIRLRVWVNPNDGPFRMKKKATDKTTNEDVAFRLGADYKFHTPGIEPCFVIVATPFDGSKFLFNKRRFNFPLSKPKIIQSTAINCRSSF